MLYSNRFTTRLEGELIKMPELKAIFMNEEAVRLLNYFISYKEIISKNEITPTVKFSGNVNAVEIIAEPERIALK
jgi:hypothetical protein